MGSTGFPESDSSQLDFIPEHHSKGEPNSNGVSLYPEINNIKDENKLRCFNKDMIIKGELEDHPILHLYLDKENLYSAIDQIYAKNIAVSPPFGKDSLSQSTSLSENQSVDLCAVFYLMSISPQVEATHCKKLLDKTDKHLWCPSLFNVLLVLSNWGVSLEVLGVEKQPHKFYSQNLPENDLELPKLCNVEMILHVIASKVSRESMDDRDKIHLIVCLARVSLESEMNSVRFWFWETVKSVVDSLAEWSEAKAQLILRRLNLATINVEVALQFLEYVFCHKKSERCMTIRHLAVLGLIDRLYSEADLPLQTPENLLVNLPPPTHLAEKLGCAQLFVLIVLLRIHMVIQIENKSPADKHTLKSVWTFVSQLENCLTTREDSDHSRKLSKVLARLGTYALSERRRLYDVGLVEAEETEQSDNDDEMSDSVSAGA